MCMSLACASTKYAHFDSYLTPQPQLRPHPVGHLGVLPCWDPGDISDPATQSDAWPCHVLAAKDMSLRGLEVQVVVQFPAFSFPGRPVLHTAPIFRVWLWILFDLASNTPGHSILEESSYLPLLSVCAAGARVSSWWLWSLLRVSLLCAYGR